MSLLKVIEHVYEKVMNGGSESGSGGGTPTGEPFIVKLFTQLNKTHEIDRSSNFFYQQFYASFHRFDALYICWFAFK